MNYELKKSEHGHTQLKNGSGAWTSPVIVDGNEFFKSGKEAAEHLDCSPVTIANALTKGHPVMGHDVKRPTRAEIERAMSGYESRSEPDPDAMVWRVSDDGHVEVKNGPRRWTRALVVGDYFYVSAHAAGREEKMHHDTIRRRARDESDEHVVWALPEHVPDDAVRVHTDNARRAPDARAADHDFQAVEWPDGRVDVRHRTGGDILFSRDRRQDLPSEVVDRTHWITI